MDGAEVVPIDVGVELRRGEVGVAEHFLHGAQVGPALEQMGGERMAERVRRDALAQSRTARIDLDDAPGPDARQRRAASIEKKNTSALAAIEPGSDFADVRRDPPQRGLAERNDALLPAFSEHAHNPLPERNVL